MPSVRAFVGLSAFLMLVMFALNSYYLFQVTNPLSDQPHLRWVRVDMNQPGPHSTRMPPLVAKPSSGQDANAIPMTIPQLL